MVKLHGKEFKLADLPQICSCGNWNCPNSYKGKPGIIEKLEKAKEEGDANNSKMC